MDHTQVMVYFSMFAHEFPLESVAKKLGIEPTESYEPLITEVTGSRVSAIVY
jgi:hypothetical protein